MTIEPVLEVLDQNDIAVTLTRYTFRLKNVLDNEYKIQEQERRK